MAQHRPTMPRLLSRACSERWRLWLASWLAGWLAMWLAGHCCCAAGSFTQSTSGERPLQLARFAADAYVTSAAAQHDCRIAQHDCRMQVHPSKPSMPAPDCVPLHVVGRCRVHHLRAPNLYGDLALFTCTGGCHFYGHNHASASA